MGEIVLGLALENLRGHSSCNMMTPWHGLTPFNDLTSVFTHFVPKNLVINRDAKQKATLRMYPLKHPLKRF